jgi:endonuclease YncB( thermonuclease family)
MPEDNSLGIFFFRRTNMKNLLHYLYPLVFSVVALTVHAETCKVVKVADGDTLTLRCDQQPQERVRLWGIDAPEKGQAHGQKATQALREICAGKTAAVTRNGKDHYGRTLGVVVCDGVESNREMVKRGYAWVYREYKHDKSWLELEAQARADKIGLWADVEPEYPSAFRKKWRNAKPAVNPDSHQVE